MPALPYAINRRALQGAVILACLVPIAAGGAGALNSCAAFAEGWCPAPLASHVHYLSGLLLAIGLAFIATVPRIEQRGDAFRLLTFIVFVGGVARAFGVLREGYPGPAMLGGLGMEMVVTPLLCLWQAAVARDFYRRQI